MENSEGLSRMDLVEIITGILTLAVGIILGWLGNWYYYRKQRKEGEANYKILKELRQHVNARIRLGDSKDGKIVERSDGRIAIDWKKEMTESMGIVDSVTTVLTKGKQSD